MKMDSLKYVFLIPTFGNQRAVCDSLKFIKIWRIGGSSSYVHWPFLLQSKALLNVCFWKLKESRSIKDVSAVLLFWILDVRFSTVLMFLCLLRIHGVLAVLQGFFWVYSPWRLGQPKLLDTHHLAATATLWTTTSRGNFAGTYDETIVINSVATQPVETAFK